MCRVLSDGAGNFRSSLMSWVRPGYTPTCQSCQSEAPKGPWMCQRNRWALTVGADRWHSIRIPWECGSNRCRKHGISSLQICPDFQTKEQFCKGIRDIPHLIGNKDQGDVLEKGTFIILSWLLRTNIWPCKCQRRFIMHYKKTET